MAYKDIGNPAIRILDYNYENGALKLFQTVDDKKNPYHSDLELFGCPATRWNIDYRKEVSEYEKLFTRLDSKKELTDYKKKKIAITKKYHDLLFEEYGLTDEEFIVSKQTPTTIDNISNKTLVKKLPGLRIENNIEYV